MEDLLNHCNLTKDIKGVDIGTGSSCIYCLLGVRMNPHWKMYALEIDRENIKYAEQNVQRNNLQNQIQIVDQGDNKEIFKKLFSIDAGRKTFTFCNPPFYSSKEELIVGENRTGKRKRQHSSLTPNNIETVTEGGELGFVTKIINESIELKTKIEIYSTMLGCKKTLDKIITLLKEHKISNYTETEFIQGNVFRWGIAWSFSQDISSFNNLAGKEQDKSTNLLKYVFKDKTISDVQQHIIQIFSDLKISINEINEDSKNCRLWELCATENTWSNQRRKRRAEQRNELIGSPTKHIDQDLKMGFELREIEEKSTQIQIFYIGGTMSKDCVNQVLQYIKNHS